MRPEVPSADDKVMELGFTAAYTVLGLGILALNIWQIAVSDPASPWYTDVADIAAPLPLACSPLVALSSFAGQEWAGVAKIFVDWFGDAIGGAFIMVEGAEP